MVKRAPGSFYCDMELRDDCYMCGALSGLKSLDDGTHICEDCLARIAFLDEEARRVAAEEDEDELTYVMDRICDLADEQGDADE